MEDEIYKNCVNAEDIYDIIDGEASKELCDLFSEHIKTCEKCRKEYESIQKLEKALKNCTSEPSADFAKNTLARLKKVKRNPFIRITEHPAFKSATAVAACLLIIFVVCSKGIFGTAEEILDKQNYNDQMLDMASVENEDFSDRSAFDAALYTKHDGNSDISDEIDSFSTGLEEDPISEADAELPQNTLPPSNSLPEEPMVNSDDEVSYTVVDEPVVDEPVVVEPSSGNENNANSNNFVPPYIPSNELDGVENNSNGSDATTDSTVSDENKSLKSETTSDAFPQASTDKDFIPAPNAATSDSGANTGISNPMLSDAAPSVSNPSSSDSGGKIVVENPTACDAMGNHTVPEYIEFPTVLIDTVTITNGILTGETTFVSTENGIYFEITTDTDNAEYKYEQILIECTDRSAEYADIIEEQKNYVQEPIEVAPGEPVPVIPMLPEDYGKPTVKEIEKDFFIDILEGHETSCGIYWYENGIFYRLTLPLEYIDGNEIRFKDLTLIKNPTY